MKTMHRFAIAAATAVMFSAFDVAAYEQLSPVTIQKDSRGRVTSESVQRLEYARQKIEQHGTLRVWVEGKMAYAHLPPDDPGYPPQERRKRALLERIVAGLSRVMGEVPPGEEYPSVGPYVAVTANLQGLQRLVDDGNVSAFFVLVPSY